MYERAIASSLQTARADTPVVLLSGPRQIGKSTLARRAAQTPIDAELSFIDKPSNVPAIAPTSVTASATISRYFTLDDAVTFASISVDPQGWLEASRSSDWTVIDEIQRVPELLLAIKREVDLDRRPNRFLLTGSANVMTIPHVADSLAGRIELLQMWQLAQSEIESTRPNFFGRAFSTDAFGGMELGEERTAILERALRGGYPEALHRSSRARRMAWFGSYLTTVVQREIRSISAIDDNAAIVRVLRGLASRSGQPRNIAGLAHDIGIPATSVSRYIELLKATYLIAELPAWSGGVDGRVVRSPKLLHTDSGLYGYLLNLTVSSDHAGFLLETFVGTELLKLISFAGSGEYALLHFRGNNQREVDFVLERSDGKLVAIEVKATTSPSPADFRGIKALAELAGKRFHRGFVLHCGHQAAPFGEGLWAIPIPALWRA